MQWFHGGLMIYPMSEGQNYDALVEQINRTNHHSWNEDWRVLALSALSATTAPTQGRSCRFSETALLTAP
jgi:hypothetical protein